MAMACSPATRVVHTGMFSFIIYDQRTGFLWSLDWLETTSALLIILGQRGCRTVGLDRGSEMKSLARDCPDVEQASSRATAGGATRSSTPCGTPRRGGLAFAASVDALRLYEIE